MGLRGGSDYVVVGSVSFSTKVPLKSINLSLCHPRECGDPESGGDALDSLQELYTFRFLKTERSKSCKAPGIRFSPTYAGMTRLHYALKR